MDLSLAVNTTPAPPTAGRRSRGCRGSLLMTARTVAPEELPSLLCSAKARASPESGFLL
jgi:hypothetical protein